MTINMVEVITEKSENLQFYIQDSTNGFVIHDIQGLDPVKAEIVSSSFGSVDGTQHQSSRRGNRNIVLTLGYAPDFITTTVGSLRKILYSKLMPKSSVRLLFHMSDGTVPEILGNIETLESPLFVEKPEATISIICFKSDFIDPVEVELNGFTGIDDPANYLEFEYLGTTNTGVRLILNIDRTITEFTWRHYGSDNIINSINFVGSEFDGTELLSGDILEISTVEGSKGAWLTRGTSRYSVLYNISTESTYFQIVPGQNFMQVIAAGVGIPIIISYFTKYGGL